MKILTIFVLFLITSQSLFALSDIRNSNTLKFQYCLTVEDASPHPFLFTFKRTPHPYIYKLEGEITHQNISFSGTAKHYSKFNKVVFSASVADLGISFNGEFDLKARGNRIAGNINVPTESGISSMSAVGFFGNCSSHSYYVAFESLPDISDFATEAGKSDQFIVDTNVITGRHPYLGVNANNPHDGAHLEINNGE